MGEPFVLGVNDFYDTRLPDVNLDRVEERLEGIVGLGAKAVRFLLPWHELQPESRSVPDATLRWLESYLNEAKDSGLHVVPVFFCGRLGELSWLPHWMCETPHRDPKPLDFYRDRDLIRAQQLQIDVVVGAFSDHEAVLGWDLGRETSALTPPPDSDAARSRLLWLLEALKKRDEGHVVTFSLSQTDLEEDLGVRPASLAEELDFISLRIDPGDTSRIVHAEDAAGFYCTLTQTLSGKPVLISELVADGDEAVGEGCEVLLESTRESGASGVIAWSDDCVLDMQFREAFRQFAVSKPQRVESPFHIRVDEKSYYASPEPSLRAAYDAYRKDRESSESSHGPGLLVP